MADQQLNVSLKSFKDQWAKDLGYKNFKEYQEANRKSYSGDIKQRLSQGAGFGEAFSGGIKEAAGDFRKALSPKDMAKKAYMGIFKGDDILSAYMRGRLVKKAKPKPEQSSKQEFTESYDKKLVGRDKSGRFTKLTEDEQWNQQRKYGLTKLTPTSPTPESDGSGMGGDWSTIAGSVETIRKAVSSLLDFERESGEQSERDKQAQFLKQQDELEASLESKNATTPTQVTAEVEAPKASEGGGNFITKAISGIFDFIGGGITKAFKLLFKPSTLLKVLGRVFIIATIIVSLFKGIMAGFDRWKETGSIKEAIIAGLGAIVDFLSFGFFGEDTVRNVFDTVGEWIGKIKDTIVETFYNVKDWIVNNVGVPQFAIKLPLKKEPITIGPYYPFKDNPKSSEPEYSKRPDKTTEKKTDKKEDSQATQPKPLQQKSEEDIIREKAKDIIGKDVSNMSEEEIQKMLPPGTDLSDFEVDMDGKLQPLGSFFSNSSPTPLQGMVQQYGGDEAVSGLQKDQEALGKFNAEGGISSQFDNLKGNDTGGSLTGAKDAIAGKLKEGGVTPEPVTPFGSATSGATIAQGSADVEYGQREEMSSPGGNIFNSPQITNNQSSTRDKSTPPADVMNFDFADALMRT